MGPNQRTCIASKAGAPTNEPGSISYLPFTPVGFKGGSVVKNLPAMQETWVRFLAREDHLEKAMAIHSSILAWRIPWTDHAVAELDTTEQLTLHLIYNTVFVSGV